MKTTPEQRKKWLDWISTGTLNWHLSRISLDYLSPEGVIKALIADIEELEAQIKRGQRRVDLLGGKRITEERDDG